MNNDMSIRTSIVTPEGQAGATRAPALSDLAAERPQQLPRDFPQQPGDTVAVGAQARQIATGGQSGTPEALSFWDHPAQSAPAGQRNLEIDQAGSYRVV